MDQVYESFLLNTPIQFPAIPLAQFEFVLIRAADISQNGLSAARDSDHARSCTAVRLSHPEIVSGT